MLQHTAEKKTNSMGERGETINRATDTTFSDNSQAYNQLSASFVGFISRILIERNFFQNNKIPIETLICLINDLIRIIGLENHKGDKPEVLNVATELQILYKQLRGIELTPEEQRYDYADKRIDVVGEIFNGIKYSAFALLGTSFWTSFTNAVSQRLWSHIPSIVGYFSAATIVAIPEILQYAVQRVLDYSNLTEETKTLVAPWLNAAGRLALGFVPKVTATNKGVHYHYPNLNGHSETVSPNQTVTLRGDKLTIEQKGMFETPDGHFDATYVMEYQLSGVEMTEQTVEITVISSEGKRIPVVFHKTSSAFGPEITVSSPDKNLEAYWGQFFQAQSEVAEAEPLAIMPTACKTAMMAPSIVPQIERDSYRSQIFTIPSIKFDMPAVITLAAASSMQAMQLYRTHELPMGTSMMLATAFGFQSQLTLAHAQDTSSLEVAERTSAPEAETQAKRQVASIAKSRKRNVIDAGSPVFKVSKKSYSTRPDIARLDNGAPVFAVVWEFWPDNEKVKLRFYDEYSNPLSNITTVNTVPVVSVRAFPAVASLSDGSGVVVVWLCDDGVCANTVNKDGIAGSAQVVVSQSTQGKYAVPQAYAVKDGSYGFVWLHTNVTTIPFGVLGRTYFPNATARTDAFMIKSDAVYDDLSLSVACDDKDKCVVVFQDGVSPNTDILKLKFSPNNGTLIGSGEKVNNITAENKNPYIALSNEKEVTVWQVGESDRILSSSCSLPGGNSCQEIQIYKNNDNAYVGHSVVSIQPNGDEIYFFITTNYPDRDIFSCTRDKNGNFSDITVSVRPTPYFPAL